jgi:hypothetical protein
MARLSFGRTVIQTVCEVMYYNENNEKRNATVTVYGNYNMDNVIKPISEQLGTKRFVVETIKHKSFYGKITLDDFAKHCQKTNEKEW